MAKNEKTSKKVASIASKLLKDTQTSKAVKSLAASALTQVADKKGKVKSLENFKVKEVNTASAIKNETMKIAIGIKDANRQAVAIELTKVLADETILYTKTKNAHWNVEGPDFYDKHKFFETQFEELDEMIDSVAERIRTIGHYAPATLKSYLSLTHLTEQSRAQNDSAGFIKELLEDHESIIIILREHIKSFADDFQDLGTSDFITGLMEAHEKMAWFLRAHLKK